MYIVYLFVLLPLYAFMAALLGNTGNFILENTHLICLTQNAGATHWLQAKHLKVFLLWKKKFYLIPFTWSSLAQLITDRCKTHFNNELWPPLICDYFVQHYSNRLFRLWITSSFNYLVYNTSEQRAVNASFWVKLMSMWSKGVDGTAVLHCPLWIA